MPTWVKVVLIVVLVGFVVLAVVVVVAARWVKSQAGTLSKESEVVMAEAEAFGKGKDGEACVAEALTRLKTSSGFIGDAKVKMFLQHCLSAATVAPETCEGVPPPMEIMDSARWIREECERRGLANNQRCLGLISALQVHCAMMKREAERSRSVP
jgi:hypothetical protein